MQTKICTKCGIEKPLSEFAKDNRRKSGRGAQCYTCVNKDALLRYHNQPKDKESKRQKKNRIKSKYGLTIEQHEQMYLDQNGCCAICGKAMAYSEVQTDHNHLTDKIRGLLCFDCNIGIGHLKCDDGPEILIKAISYLEKTK